MNLTEIRQAQEEFSSVIQEALTYGPDPMLNKRYREARAELQARYPEVRSSLGRLWTTTSDPARFPGQHTDPIESILASATLDGLLRRDARQIQRDLEDIQTAFEICSEVEVGTA